jgi:broad specificity phosphatase PhoE
VKLLLVRHGNTFAPGDAVVWAGASNDVALVERGVQQAWELGRALKAEAGHITAMYSSPLQRCTQFAMEMIQEMECGKRVVVDPRLNELELGEWTGLTNEEVERLPSGALQDGWNKRSEWPVGVFGSSEQVVKDEVKDFAAELLARKYASDEIVVAVTSNGRLRYFLDLIPGAFSEAVANGTFKVGTGNVCCLSYDQESHPGWRVSFWNLHARGLAERGGVLA